MSNQQAEKLSQWLGIVGGAVGILAIFLAPFVTFQVTDAVYAERLAGHDKRIIALESQKSSHDAERVSLENKLSEISNRLARIEGKLENTIGGK